MKEVEPEAGFHQILDEVLSHSKSVHEQCLKLLVGITDSILNKPVNELFLVSQIILSSIIRLHEAISLLAEKSYHVEMAILALAQFELKMDMLFIGTQTHRARKWIEHDLGNRRVWPTRTEIMEIYKSRPWRRLRALEQFEYLSAIKHGNFNSREAAFSIRRGEKTIRIVSTTIGDEDSLRQCATFSIFSSANLVDCVEQWSVVASVFGALQECGESVSRMKRELSIRHKTIHGVGIEQPSTVS